MSDTDELLERHRRQLAFRKRHLTQTQWDALDKFRYGHGIGDYAYLSWPTAKVLWRLGLIQIGSYWDDSGGGRSHVVGYITKRGHLALIQAGYSGPSEWHEPIKRYGWRPWNRTRAQSRESITSRLRAKRRGLFGSRRRA